ncbi:hypothetical protein HMPREF0043_00819 [Actinobaculum sp. oral taxon 183 str. F0552]|nr:hypothetical protein HMPREF0043_00819 [Actinobaculum sp. oral taxon 183 str. F0552]
MLSNLKCFGTSNLAFSFFPGVLKKMVFCENMYLLRVLGRSDVAEDDL